MIENATSADLVNRNSLARLMAKLVLAIMGASKGGFEIRLRLQIRGDEIYTVIGV